MIIYKSLAPIKAITFDLDDTLYPNHQYIIAAEKTLMQHITKRFPAFAQMGRATWRAMRKQAISQDPRLASDMIVLRRKVLALLFTKLGVTTEQCQQEVELAYDVFYRARSDFDVLPEYLSCLSQLSQRLPLVAITNGNVDLARIGIEPYFAKSYHASVTQPAKPHPRMFQLAAEYLALQPQQILHVGDNLEKDVRGALRAGYQAAWFADDREMNLQREPATLLPHVQLSSLKDLLTLTK